MRALAVSATLLLILGMACSSEEEEPTEDVDAATGMETDMGANEGVN